MEKIIYCYFILLQTFFTTDCVTLKLENYLYCLFIRTLRNFSNLSFILLTYDYQILTFSKFLQKKVFIIIIFLFFIQFIITKQTYWLDFNIYANLLKWYFIKLTHFLMKVKHQMIDHLTKYFNYYLLLFIIFNLYCLNFFIYLFKFLAFIRHHFRYDFNYHEAFNLDPL